MTIINHKRERERPTFIDSHPSLYPNKNEICKYYLHYNLTVTFSIYMEKISTVLKKVLKQILKWSIIINIFQKMTPLVET